MEYGKIFYYLPIMVGLYMVTYHFLRKLQKRPPRPFLCFPLIGHFPLLSFPLAECLAKLAQQYGPIVFLEFGWMTSLSVCSPAAAEECLSKNDAIFCNRPHSILIGKYVGNNFTSINFAPYGPHWRNLRKIASLELLSSHRLHSATGVHIRADEVNLLIRRLYRSLSCDSQRMVELRPELFDLAMSVVTRLIFGKRYDQGSVLAKKLELMITNFFGFANVVHFGDFVPYLRVFDWMKEKRLKNFKYQRFALMEELIQDYHHHNHNNNANHDDEDDVKVKPMIDYLLGLQQSQPDYYKDDIIFSVLLDLLVGGSDSSATTMEWALSLLLNHPEVVEKARIEIDNNVGHERLVDESDLKNLPYIGCILKETLRMYPPNPTLFPHESSEDCILGGYRIPRQTALDVNIWAIQNDPKIWEDPQNYRPERFQGVESFRIGFKMLPFGAGRRICPGEGLAIRVLGLALASLIQCFEWQRIDDNLVDMTKVPDLFMHRVQPLRAKLRPRQAMIKLLTKM